MVFFMVKSKAFISIMLMWTEDAPPNMFQFLRMVKTGEGPGEREAALGRGSWPSAPRPSTEPPVTTMGQDKQDPRNVI